MDEISLDCQKRMAKTAENLRATLVTLRTGRANPQMLNGLMIDYYGSIVERSRDVVGWLTADEIIEALRKGARL